MGILILTIFIILVAVVVLLIVLTRANDSARLNADKYKRQRDIARKYLGNIAAYSNNSDVAYSYDQAQLGLIESVQEHPDSLE